MKSIFTIAENQKSQESARLLLTHQQLKHLSQRNSSKSFTA